MKKDLEKQIAELEKKVKELEERTVFVPYPVYIQPPIFMPTTPQTGTPFPPYTYPQIWCGTRQK